MTVFACFYFNNQIFKMQRISIKHYIYSVTGMNMVNIFSYTQMR